MRVRKKNFFPFWDGLQALFFVFLETILCFFEQATDNDHLIMKEASKTHWTSETSNYSDVIIERSHQPDTYCNQGNIMGILTGDCNITRDRVYGRIGAA